MTPDTQAPRVPQAIVIRHGMGRTHRGSLTNVVALKSAWKDRFAFAAGVGLLLGSLVLARPAVAADPTLDVTRIDAHIRSTMEAWAVPGVAVGIARDGEVIHLAAFGRAGTNDRPMASNTPIIVGSVGKSITALAVRQLVESGELDLGAPVDQYLPWFGLRDSPSVTRQITIEDLLEHTSGISTADGQDQRWYAPGLTPEGVVRAMASIAPDRPAGTYEYSNLNYVLLGVVVEAVSGQSYSDYLRDHIFEPLGMLDSTTDLRTAAHGGMAEGHRYLFGLATPFAEPFPSGMVPAGYQISTAEDMSHFVAALSNGGIYGGVDVLTPNLPRAGGRTLLTDWQTTSLSDAGLVSNQSGSTLVTNADILTMPGRRLGVVVLLNANPIQFNALPAGASDLAFDVANMALGQPVVTTAPSVRTVYLWLDGVLLILAGLLAAHVARARSWRHRLATSRNRRFFAGRTIVADFILPVGVLVGIPMAIGATGSSAAGDVVAGWRFVFWTLPDVALSLVVLSLVPLAVGVAKLTVAMQASRTS